MPTSPLFVADVDTLKAKLRLSGVAAASDAADVIDEAVLQVRGGFYRELTPSRVTALQAIPFTADPTTNDQVTRATANLTEVKWVKLLVMRSLPMLFIDASADQNQIYHDEAAFRDAASGEVNREIRRLEDEVRHNLRLLSGEQSVGSEQRIRAATLEPATTPPRPGDTARLCKSSKWTGGNV